MNERTTISRRDDLLSDVERALDDWIVTYAEDCCDPQQVRNAWQRIMNNGGTIGYVTDLRDRVHAARSATEEDGK